MLDPKANPDQHPENAAELPWPYVYGELITFDDPEIRLAAIDRLERFHPGGPCLHRRVLGPVLANEPSFRPGYMWREAAEAEVSKR